MPLLKIRILALTALLLVATGGIAEAGWFSGLRDSASMWFSSAGQKMSKVRILKESRPVFTHKKHIQDNGVACDECHKLDKKEDRLSVPDAQACASCHEGDEASNFESKGGKSCIPGMEPAKSDVHFSHATHVDGGVDCQNCHTSAADSAATVPAVVMADCMKCHDSSGDVPLQCSDCHGKITKNWKPATHTASLKATHGGLVGLAGAGSTQNDCRLCHEQLRCDSCHASEAPRSHTNFFRHRGHGIKASMDRTSCAVCHKSDSCSQCHAESAPVSHTGTWGGSKDRHCLTCHFPLQDNGCATCHKTTSSHSNAPTRPTNTAHKNATNDTCRECHTAGRLTHYDSGDQCLECHK
ncbi:MAG: cytochrome c3 family protein [Planctomycetes bacterium]|nr:cytochrome c3 family protein [Planctomycetota bacterium]